MSGIFSVIGLLVSSTGTAVLRKVLFQLPAPGIHGNVHAFEKPYFTSWESCFALVICLPIFWLGLLFHKKQPSKSDIEQPLIGKELSNEGGEPVKTERPNFKTKWLQFLGLSIPGLLNAVSIIVAGIGLQYITATVMLMLSGSCIIFTAALSIVFLKCRLNAYHITGIAFTIIGVVIVSLANLIFPTDSNGLEAGSSMTWSRHGATKMDGNILLGISMTLLSAFLAAGRLVAEELALEGTDLHPFQVLGYEGIWGTVGSALVIYPIAWFIPGRDPGHKTENIVDSLLMLADRDLSIVNAFFFLTVVGMNVFGLFVTSQLGSVFRAVLLTTRTASVWIVNLLLFYLHVDGGKFGESWRSPPSYIQLAGFCLLLLGTIIYAQGSSVVALLWSNSQPDDDMLGQHRPPRVTQASAVTRLRPYTSLYIPNVPQRKLASSSPIPIGSVPNEVVWPHQRTEFPITHSLPNNVGLAVGPSHLNVENSATPRSVYPETPRSPESPGLSQTIQGGSPQSLHSGSFFIQSLTHRTSWMVNNELITPRRGNNMVQPSLDQHSGQATARDDPSFDLTNVHDRNPTVSGHGRNPWPTVFLRNAEQQPSDRQSVGSFTFPVETSAPTTKNIPPEDKVKETTDESKEKEEEDQKPRQISRGPSKPTLGQSPSPTSFLEYKKSKSKPASKLPNVEEEEDKENVGTQPKQSTVSTNEEAIPAEPKEERKEEEKQPDLQVSLVNRDQSGKIQLVVSPSKKQAGTSRIQDIDSVKVSLPNTPNEPNNTKLVLSPLPDTSPQSAQAKDKDENKGLTESESASSQPKIGSSSDPKTLSEKAKNVILGLFAAASQNSQDNGVKDGEVESSSHKVVQQASPSSTTLTSKSQDAPESAKLSSHSSEGKLIARSPGADSDNSGGSGHVYGQSPTAEVLTQRRSISKVPRPQLAPLNEDEGSEGSEELDFSEAFDENEAKDKRNSIDDDEWTNLDSHRILFDDSDSDVSDGSDGVSTGRKRSTDRGSNFSKQGSRTLKDVESPEEFHSPRESFETGSSTKRRSRDGRKQ